MGAGCSGEDVDSKAGSYRGTVFGLGECSLARERRTISGSQSSWALFQQGKNLGKAEALLGLKRRVSTCLAASRNWSWSPVGDSQSLDRLQMERRVSTGIVSYGSKSDQESRSPRRL